MSTVGAEDAVYWFKLSTSSCAPGPWLVLLTNTSTQAPYAAYGDDLNDTLTIGGLPPGTYTVQYEYVGSYCQGSGGSITVPECVPTTFYADVDGDGFGDAANPVVYCLATPPSGYVGNSSDLDPQHITYPDNDGDLHGYGNAPTPGGVTNNDDPDDNNAATYPGAAEVCDGADNNGDGLIDNLTYFPTFGGLRAYLPFGGNANDASGNGSNGTVVGATLTTDRFGAANSAYQFNGSGDHITFAGPPMTNTDDWAMSIWAKPSSFSSEGCAIMIGSDAGGPGPNTGYSLLVSPGGGLTGLSSGIAFMGSGTTLPSTGTWYHLVMT
ncbi:MAG TPA: MopE-related protein, partial [Flavobacteriales bacterium]|nr:MopE-related protein [Flavobacteriales bacterium]